MKSPEVKKRKTPTPRYGIYIAVVTDGLLPHKSNLLNITAYYSEELQFRVNVEPQFPFRGGSSLSEELRASCTVDAVPLHVAIQRFAAWLERFKGVRVPITSSVAYWHLIYHFYGVLGAAPLASHPVDVASYVSGGQGQVLARFKPVSREPEKAVRERREQVAAVVGGGARTIRWA